MGKRGFLGKAFRNEEYLASARRLVSGFDDIVTALSEHEPEFKIG